MAFNILDWTFTGQRLISEKRACLRHHLVPNKGRV